MTACPDELLSNPVELELGPTHPLLQGTARLQLMLDGERIVRATAEVGFGHRGVEKQAEALHWAQVVPHAERLSGAAPLLGAFGYCLAVERLLQLEVPLRGQYLRTLAAELCRIGSHLAACSAAARVLGSSAPAELLGTARAVIGRVLEALTGAGSAGPYGCIGGVAHTMPPHFSRLCRDALQVCFAHIDDADRLLTGNRIFVDRMDGVGRISGPQAVAYGLTGPCLRATGVAYDVRRAHPYDAYGRIDFDVVTGSGGDCYDRWLVYFEEMRQSRRIIAQALADMPGGAHCADDRRVTLPAKNHVYQALGGLIDHFKLTVEGAQVPSGEVYSYTEGARGELGFYLVSNGTGTPAKCHIRSPCYAMAQALGALFLPGATLADVAPIVGSLGLHDGDCDR
jgi:NADH-quinone oxidoreductase subunit D